MLGPFVSWESPKIKSEIFWAKRDTLNVERLSFHLFWRRMARQVWGYPLLSEAVTVTMVELCTSVPPSPKRDSCNPDEQSYHGLFIRRWFWENPKCYNGWLVPQLQWLSASSDPCYLYTRYSTFFGQPLCFCLRAKAPQLRFYPTIASFGFEVLIVSLPCGCSPSQVCVCVWSCFWGGI